MSKSVSQLKGGAIRALCFVCAIPAVASAQTCVTVDRVELSGVTLLDETELQSRFADELGCIGLDGLNALLETVTLAYVGAGYIAARAYLPEQDLSDGSLTIAVIEGRVADIELRENGEPAPRRAASAFPGMLDRPLELRSLEQGLAQINRLPSSDATSQLVPGSDPGDSIIAVEVTQTRPWTLSATIDNRGATSTGEHNFGLTYGRDNLFGLNDRWTFSYQRSMEPSPLALDTDTPVGNSYSVSGSIPYGFWTYGVSLSASDYTIEIPGVTGPIESSGNSRTIRLSAERLLFLSEAGRWDAGVALNWSDNENQILGATIDTASRQLATLDTYLRHARAAFGGQLESTLTLRNGLDAFGAFNDDAAPAGSPVAKYTAFLLDVAFQRLWRLGDQALVLSSRFSAQYSDHNLFGSEQFSTGGFSSVRGARTSLLFGNRGVQVTNTLTLPQAFDLGNGANLSPYIGLDASHVYSQSEFGIGGGSLASYSLGFTISLKQFSIDAVYSEIFSAPDSVQIPESGLFTVQARLVF